ncbi:MAG TPA: DNA-formamidopyrimidine glycosylase family protein [Thermoanaerobaculaceae bacterium]|nr:DNA-formamidopyrimidine glycosylase family protein [Thermoanaerobaculaceae bacterium]HPS78247.1 DNA-formamidopyrimidine glycosylase family protein [Thermoanaerobaculaceae bacterium]
MPELPDLTVYLEALQARVLGVPLVGIRLGNPFVLRTVAPGPSAFTGKPVTGVRRLGKRLVLAFDGELLAAIHLMILGRLHWRPPGARLGGKHALAAFDFPDGTLLLTESGTKRRAGVHLLAGEAALGELDRGGIEVMEADLAAFETVLRRENHTLMRTLTDPRLLAGIGNAYSDEILHRARLSPLQLTSHLSHAAVEVLHRCCREVLSEWTSRLRDEAAGGFPEHVTAFREGMAVHGRYGRPCPVCGSPVQRLAYAENEANYCATCQTDGRLLADRALSRLLRDDWPRSFQELEEQRTAHRVIVRGAG